MSPYRVAEVPRRRPKAVPHVLGRPDLLADARIDLSPVTARNEALEADGNTDIAIESADIVLLRDEVTAVLDARHISSRSYRRVKHNVAQAFTFNGIGIPWSPPGAPGLGVIVIVAAVTSIFLNSIDTRPSLLFHAITSVGRPPDAATRHRWPAPSPSASTKLIRS